MSGINLKITNETKHIAQTPEVNSRFSTEEKRRLAGAAKDFESLLTGMMLKSMNQTTNGLFGSEGFGGDMFDTMFETKVASFISDSKSFGVSDQIFRKITGEDLSKFTLEEKRNKNSLKSIKDITAKHDTGLKPSLGSINRLDKFQDIIQKAAKEYDLNENLIKSVILTESAANPKAISKANAKGLMQLMDGTAKDMGVRNSFDPEQNIFGGVKYLSKMFRQYEGDLELALAAYNAGPGNVDKHKGVPPFDETKNYINRVVSYLNYLDG